jgi:hypothetical protein
MTPERTFVDYLEDMRDAIERVAEFIGGPNLFAHKDLAPRRAHKAYC